MPDPIAELLDQLRQELGLRPETRLDNLISPDGTTWVRQADGTFKQVR